MGRTVRWVAAVAAAVVGCAVAVPVAGAVPVTPVASVASVAGQASADLVEQVTRAARDRVGAAEAAHLTGAEVRVLRSDRRQAYGTVVLTTPPGADALPRDWLFVAERDGAGPAWRVALDGQPAFADLAARSGVLSEQESGVFAAHGGRLGAAVNGDYRTGMGLPWAVGQSWTVLGGPHAHDAGSGPWSSLDLAGGDQRVLAVRDGLAYTPCVGMIRILHPDGYASRYYHLWNHLRADGTPVSAGTHLGDTGTEIGCGGAANARHVHFSLMHNGNFVGIANHIIGKWLFRNGGAQYGGSALHGSRSVPVGGQVHNYGALGRTQGIVDANDLATVNRRSGPGVGYPVSGTVADGATVSIACSADGTSHTGRWGTSSLWNRLTDGTWVSDAYVYTGLAGPVNGRCGP
ncbi:peptidoglycan DD-metalloendopeptidase family protein [Saccharothrix longispora]|uniref:peptidoglycan DD-metalloendopeptidase family protein n=1 Tax=Saccharothrix longispora TaxID=33920 RepID=UPI0028FD4A8D|nr:peptidoglycan DD-metalloendopeptidase family protein [Saccharothrix longispora]MBY8848181.1 peptidoglycan DD-metalloendopeptidase family protein [Saccharothrix sp. MB29]MDU0292684.1 peptidoglycan DD-metalloendopeptidase family protein [Saccharothrix longispora]